MRPLIVALTIFYFCVDAMHSQTSGMENNAQLQSITIGSQMWMVNNLDVTHYQNGDPIYEAKTIAEWKDCYKQKNGCWCNYDNDPSKGEKYGKLYNWYAVNDSRGIAPDGFHVPTNDEWKTLISSLGGEGAAFSKMKSPSVFSALSAGQRDFQSCQFYMNGEISFWWTATSGDTYNAWYYAMHFGYSQVGKDTGAKNAGFSVRCISD